MKKLSIIIVYCDKDKSFLDELIFNIKKNIKIDNEIILIDNTVTGIKPKLEYDKYFWMGENRYALQARKKGIQLAESEYTWFIDADDSILELKEFSYKEDVIIFQAIDSAKENRIITLHDKEEIISGHENIFNWDNYLIYNVFLWNKFIKTSLLKQIDKMIPEDILAVASEDKVFAVISLWLANNIHFIDFPIYDYRSNNSISASNCFSFDKFKHILFGFDKTEPLINSIIGKEAILIKNDSNKGNARYFLDKICKAESPTIVKSMFDYLQQYITLEDIKESWQQDYLYFYSTSKENYAELDKILGSPFEVFRCVKYGKECDITFEVKIVDGIIRYTPKE